MKKPLIHFPFNGNLKNIGTVNAPVTVHGGIEPSRFGGGSAYNTQNPSTSRIVVDIDSRFNVGDFTVCMWMYDENNETGYPRLVDLGGDVNGFNIEGSWEAIILNGINYNFSHYAFYEAESEKKWWHVAWIRRGDTLYAFANGIFYQSQTGVATALNIATYPTLTLLNHRASNAPFDGYLKDFRFYDYALTDAQIAHVYNMLDKDKSNV